MKSRAKEGLVIVLATLVRRHGYEKSIFLTFRSPTATMSKRKKQKPSGAARATTKFEKEE